MRAMTVRQPWAWQIIYQGKDIENRSRNIAGAYRGPVAIHAALKADEVALARLPMRAPTWVTARREFWYGRILGVVDLVDVIEGSTSEWAIPGYKHLVLAKPRALPEPIECSGALGLWTPPPALLTALEGGA